MSTDTTIPVSVDQDAAALITELGMQAKFERMLEHTLRSVPGLQRVDITLALPYDTGDETRITIEALRSALHGETDRTEDDWGAWKIATFPPDVCRYFAMLVFYEPDDAR